MITAYYTASHKAVIVSNNTDSSLNHMENHILHAIPGLKTQKIETKHSTVQIYTRGTINSRAAVLLLHGNSFNSTIFKHILSSDLYLKHKLIALDLPGHGGSSNAKAEDAEKVYTMPAYADAALEVLVQLEVTKIIVIGWSLGGHVAIEMAAKSSIIKGAMLIGCPPCDTGDVPLAFSLASNQASGKSWRDGYPAREHLSEEEMLEYATVCADAPYEEWMYEAVKRTDGAARRIMFEAFAGENAIVRQREIVQTKDVLWAICNGTAEPWINLEFIDRIKFSRLWRQQCVGMPGLLHAPFWAQPDEFQKLLSEYLVACCS